MVLSSCPEPSDNMNDQNDFGEHGDVEVSIVMAAYNAADYISLSVDSVINQTMENWELVICDDHSTDHTWEIISAITDTRVSAIRNAVNQGVSRSRNRCLELARGKFIAILDADDVWFEQKLSVQLQLLKDNPLLGIVGTNAIEIDSTGLKIGFRDFPESHTRLTDFALWKSPMLHSSIMFRKELGIVSYDETLSTAEDWELMVRLMGVSESYVIQDRLVRYRVHPRNLTHLKAMQMRADAFSVVRKFLIRSYRLSDLELSAFEKLFQYQTLSGKQTGTGLRLFLKILRIHRGPETLRRFKWFLSSRVPRR